MKAFSRTALVLFSLSPEAEAKRKPILHGYSMDSNVRLYDHLVQRMKSRCIDSGLPFFHFDEGLQRGEDFGSRFCNAIEDAFDFGYERLILVGNDSPDVRSSDLVDCARGLEEGHSQLCPSSNGGFSILAIHRQDYDRRRFLNVEWNTDRTFLSMLDVLGSSCDTGSEFVEIDSYVDLFHYVDSTQEYSELLDYIRSIVAPFFSFEAFEEEPFTMEFDDGVGFRGPPFNA